MQNIFCKTTTRIILKQIVISIFTDTTITLMIFFPLMHAHKNTHLFRNFYNNYYDVSPICNEQFISMHKILLLKYYRLNAYIFFCVSTSFICNIYPFLSFQFFFFCVPLIYEFAKILRKIYILMFRYALMGIFYARSIKAILCVAHYLEESCI